MIRNLYTEQDITKIIMYSPGIRIDEYTVMFYKLVKGLVIKVFRDGATEYHTYTLVKPGNVFKLVDDKWVLLDTMSLPPVKQYKDFIEKAAYDLALVITLYPVDYQGNKEGFYLSGLEKDFVAALTYDYFMNNTLDWLPRKVDEEVNIYTLYDDTVLFAPGTPQEKEMTLEGPDIRHSLKSSLASSPIILTPVKPITTENIITENVPLETYQIKESPKYEADPIYDSEPGDIASEDMSTTVEKEQSEKDLQELYDASTVEMSDA